MKINRNIFKEIWVSRCLYMLVILFGNKDRENLKRFLSVTFDNSVSNYKVKVYNNYKKLCTNEMNILEFLQWYYKNKPIATASGVLFKRQDQAVNILSKMLSSFLGVRKKYKGKMLQEDKGSFLYKIFYRKQLNEKVNVNAFYGCLGAPTSYFYNYYLAMSVTCTGQVLITLTHNCFERFVADNVPFLDMNDMFEFIYNVLSETNKRVYSDNEIFDRNIKKSELVNKLVNGFYDTKLADVDLIEEFVGKLSQTDINRLFYKNNLKAFMKNSKIRELVNSILMERRTYNDPSVKFLADNSDSRFSKLMYEFKDVVSEYVMYEHTTFDKIYRARRLARKSVVHIDTDSNMICVDDFYKFMKCEFFDRGFTNGRTLDEERYFAINLITYLLTDLCEKSIKVYCDYNHIYGENAKFINMKNEYLYKIMLFTNGKKHYMAIMELQEGHLVPYDKQLDMKGIQLRKVGTNAFAKEYFTDISENDILRADTIDRRLIVRKYLKFEHEVVERLKNGDLDVCKNMKVKPIEAYELPMREQSIKGMLTWNAVYGDTDPIIPVEYINVIMTTLKTIDDCAQIKIDYPDVYDKLKDGVFEDKLMKRYGAVCIGIKKEHGKIPDWVIPYIDYRDMMRYNASPIMEIWESLGLGVSGKDSNRVLLNTVRF